jgi:hypothetical protein
MVKYVVTDKALGYCKRWGNIDCTVDPGFDAETEDGYSVEDLFLLDTIPRTYVKVVDGVLTEMNQAEKDAVDNFFLNDYKLQKYLEIDEVTGKLIDQGFEFPPGSGHQFSLSAEGQLNLLGSYSAKDNPLLVYPIIWPTILDDYEFAITDAATLEAFYLTAVGTVRIIRDSGTVLKEAVRSCTTKAEVDAVNDPR